VIKLEPLLSTKLYIPPIRSEFVARPRLIEQLNKGAARKLTLISAPAGFGKSTLLSEWVINYSLPVAWLTLDSSDNEVNRFLDYLIAALQTIKFDFGKPFQALLRSPQSIPVDSMLTPMINEIAEIEPSAVLVLDDFHHIEDSTIHEVLNFLIAHFPPNIHLVIASRSDPFLPLSQMRAKSEMIEIRTEDLRFSLQEAADFLNRVMGLSLSDDDIRSLENRTEGWIAGLQLAAISLQGKENSSELIRTFSGSHRMILDYLIDEVLDQQPDSIQNFLLKTAILDRFSGELCDHLTGNGDSQQTLEYLEHANIFVIPLDNERCWYRYHHLFADLLQARLKQSTPGEAIAVLHIRASEWYEDNGLEIESFQHAAAANDVNRAERLISGKGVPLQYRGNSVLLLNWLKKLPREELDARPMLWVVYASVLNLTGRAPEAEEKLEAAQNALRDCEPGYKTDDIVGHIAVVRAMIAVGKHDLDSIIVQSRLALDTLDPDDSPSRTIVTWTLGYAHQLIGDREEALRLYEDVLANSQSSGDIVSTLAATTGLGNILESKNQLFQAAQYYRRGLDLFGNPPQPIACGVYLGLAGIYYEWNDLGAAQKYGHLSLELSQQVQGLDTPALSWLLLTRINLAQGDLSKAAENLSNAEQFVQMNNFAHRVEEVNSVKIEYLLHSDETTTAAYLAKKHNLPLSHAKTCLAQGEPSEALKILDAYQEEVGEDITEAELLKILVLQAAAYQPLSQTDLAVKKLTKALALAEPGEIIRTFVDESSHLEELFFGSHKYHIAANYIEQILAAFPHKDPQSLELASQRDDGTKLVEPLTKREIEVLRLLNSDMSGPEIADELVIALSTFQSHTKNIYSKLDVSNRRAAVTKAEDLNLL